jgi:hypothetical protein
MREEESTGAEVVKLSAVVALYALNRDPELCSDVGKKVRQSGKGVRLESKWECPQVMRKIIKYNQIIFVTSNTRNGRCPQITMN